MDSRASLRVKIGVAVNELSVSALPLTFFTVRNLNALCIEATTLKLMFAGENASGDALPPDPVPESPTVCGHTSSR